MKWYLKWEIEITDEQRIKKEAWAYSWNEVIGYFNSWITHESDVMKGEVICYMGDKPYSNDKPCLYFNAYIEEDDEEE